MHEQIQQTLKQVEREFGCRILFACESGSRAWGLASPDSDFDIRFIYAHPPEWYLDIGQPPDTIEAMLPGDLDLSGWELRKALRLFAGCNPALCEWLDSPLIYTADERFQQSLTRLVDKFFKPRRAAFHYLKMAQKTRQAHPLNEVMNAKKLFYILRPLLAALWIIERRRTPPTLFEQLLDASLAPASLVEQIRALQMSKCCLGESDSITAPDAVRRWADETLQQIGAKVEALPVNGSQDIASLNALMREWVLYRDGVSVELDMPRHS